MSNALANVYSFGNKLRNNLKALLTDPVNHLASQGNIWAADMNRALDSPATAYRRAGGVMADDPSTVAAANREQERMTAALMGTAPGFVGMTAWHGSPHRFDRFDSRKIGTGEGAQAYGHGLYLAESPDVAMKYQPRDPKLESKIMQRYSAAEKQMNYPAMQVFEDFGLNRTPEEVLSSINKAGYSAKDLKAAMDAYKVSLKEYANQAAGALYKVDLPDEMIARMLDWDKPLSQQPEAVRKALDVLDDDSKKLLKGQDPKGAKLYELLASTDAFAGMGPLGVAASNHLRGAGVPGIRYLDGGSRDTGSGTSNFVVFPGEENALRILERNGMTLADMAGQSGKIDSRLLAALGLGSAAAVAGNSLLNSGKKKMEDAKKARQQAIEKAEEK